MGLEFLFDPLTFLIFLAVNLGLVLLQRLVFKQAFNGAGSRGVALGYAFVLILSSIMGLVLGNGAFRESAGNFILACYVSLLFVSIGLLPLSLLLARRKKITAWSVFGAGVLLSTVIGFAMVLPVGADGIPRQGLSRWLAEHTPILGFFVAVSAAFSAGLRSSRD